MNVNGLQLLSVQQELRVPKALPVHKVYKDYLALKVIPVQLVHKVRKVFKDYQELQVQPVQRDHKVCKVQKVTPVLQDHKVFKVCKV